MAANINDKFKKVSADNSYAVATTVKTARTVGGGTTLEAFDLSKWADATAVNFLTYRKTTDPVTNITTVTNRVGWTALVNTSSNTLTNLTVAPGYTDLGHQVGDYIEPVPTSKWANDLVDGILVAHNQNGTLKDNIVTASKLDFTTLYSDVGSLNQQVLTTSLSTVRTITVPSSVAAGSRLLLDVSLEYNNEGGPLKDFQCRVTVNGANQGDRYTGVIAGGYYTTGAWLGIVTAGSGDTIAIQCAKSNSNSGGQIVSRSKWAIIQVG